MKLRDIAFARSGDKGSSANVAVFASNSGNYELLVAVLTASRVEKHFKHFGVGKVIRYEVPNLMALNFVLPNILDGGGSRSLRIDAQGKALGEQLLDLQLNVSKRMKSRGR